MHTAGRHLYRLQLQTPPPHHTAATYVPELRRRTGKSGQLSSAAGQLPHNHLPLHTQVRAEEVRAEEHGIRCPTPAAWGFPQFCDPSSYRYIYTPRIPCYWLELLPLPTRVGAPLNPEASQTMLLQGQQAGMLILWVGQ